MKSLRAKNDKESEIETKLPKKLKKKQETNKTK